MNKPLADAIAWAERMILNGDCTEHLPTLLAAAREVADQEQKECQQTINIGGRLLRCKFEALHSCDCFFAIAVAASPINALPEGEQG